MEPRLSGRRRLRVYPTNGSTTRTPACAKSERFRVATARPWTDAVAAIRPSLIGGAKTGQQLRSFQAGVRVPGQTVGTLDVEHLAGLDTVHLP